jgi:hypothetical protein
MCSADQSVIANRAYPLLKNGKELREEVWSIGENWNKLA